MCVRRDPVEHFKIKWGQLQVKKRLRYTLKLYTVELQWTLRHVEKVHTLQVSTCHTLYNVEVRMLKYATVKQCYIYSKVLGAAIKCKQYSGIPVETGTRVKSVKIILNIFTLDTIQDFFSNFRIK